jgi:hypothetical protein
VAFTWVPTPSAGWSAGGPELIDVPIGRRESIVGDVFAFAEERQRHTRLVGLTWRRATDTLKIVRDLTVSTAEVGPGDLERRWIVRRWNADRAAVAYGPMPSHEVAESLGAVRTGGTGRGAPVTWDVALAEGRQDRGVTDRERDSETLVRTRYASAVALLGIAPLPDDGSDGWVARDLAEPANDREHHELLVVDRRLGAAFAAAAVDVSTVRFSLREDVIGRVPQFAREAVRARLLAVTRDGRTLGPADLALLGRDVRRALGH